MKPATAPLANAAPLPPPAPTWQGVDPAAAAFYQRVLETLNAEALPYLLGGAFSVACLTGMERPTKDLDLFICRSDYTRIEAAMQRAGYRAEVAYDHWLGKVWANDGDDSHFVDLIFSSGNAVASVDEDWFTHAHDAQVLGVPVKVAPAEETIWSKAFVMERERYDGAEVAHLLRDCAHGLDWHRLLQRFGPHWRVLLSHVVLYGFIYPSERARIPAWLVAELAERLRQETLREPPPTQVCAGTLLSREQYLPDVEHQGYRDGRIEPFGSMTPRQVSEWTVAIPSREAAAPDQPDSDCQRE
jgi:hypothetical protein